MITTRRRFLAGLGLVVAAALGLSWMRRDALRRWLLSTPLGSERPGPLRDSTADVLRATVLALLDERVQPARYVDFFRWHGANVPGSRALYERFEAAVDRAARRAGHAGFRSAPRPHQQRILRSMLPVRGLTWARARRAFLAREEARYARHVTREVFRQFAHTDAWVLAGYDAWPGTPRAIARIGPAERRS